MWLKTFAVVVLFIKIFGFLHGFILWLGTKVSELFVYSIIRVSRCITLAFLLKPLFWDGNKKNKEDCHQCRIISFVKMSIVKRSFGCSIDHNVADKSYCACARVRARMYVHTHTYIYIMRYFQKLFFIMLEPIFQPWEIQHMRCVIACT
jgi:hypothetical protein